VRELAAFFSLSLTLTLVLSRPRITPTLTVGPALAAAAGVVVMFAAGFVDPSDAVTAIDVLWRPLVAIAGIMVTTAAALRLGAVQRLAAAVLPRARTSPTRLFGAVFALSAVTSAVLNNDSAVLLLTPMVVLWVQARYPDQPSLILPFAFAVFMAAGVAPLVTSNPMNLIVAELAGLGFNEYALRMLPISLAGWALTFAMLRLVFRRELTAAQTAPLDAPAPERWLAREWHGLAVVLAVLGAYPVVSYFGGSVWMVTAVGAALAVVLCRRHSVSSPRELVVTGVSWEILAFLVGVFILAIGLRNAGVVDWLSDLYDGASALVIGGVSALGSATINNHAMALTNALALEATPGAGRTEYLAALIGGDLGPRLLPMGSLAGLLWLAALRRLEVEVPLGRFIAVGAAVTAPTLALSLLLVSLT
jgi:arsenical pump membrane protein